ncbi:uncharacterized protein LOC123911351 isoform X2 [Trifolium pratense]|uniref:uncharacterized protein LOC123911351 isoform X2 n=1 Tax=Trifolium pratense TaxID=57577 RepID=UPI001E693E05|nr:uncharacterized protein LOC123911351 isoform X2 [Trifolium pratense]
MVMVLGIEEHVVENGWSPIGAPLNVQRDEHQQQQQHWNNNNINNNFDSSNAVSFGFVATAILISMFLLMAIFERFLAPSSQALFPNRRRNRRDVESPITKPGHSSPKVKECIYQLGFSFNAWRRDSHIHCSSCTGTVLSRTNFMAFSSAYNIA